MNPQPQLDHTAIMEDLAATLSALPDTLVEVSFANKGPKSAINRARFHRGISAGELLSYATKSGDSVFFLNGVDAERSNFQTGVELFKRASDDMVPFRNIVSLDIDFDAFIDGFKALAPAEKVSIIKTTFLKHYPKLKASFGDVWMVVISGNGLHIHLKLRHPLDCSDKALYERAYKLLLKRMEDAFNGEVIFDQSCCNPARTMRLPLSKNWKDPSQPVFVDVIHHNRDADNTLAVMTLWEQAEAQQSMAQVKSRTPGVWGVDDSYRGTLRESLTHQKVLQHFGYSKNSSMQDLGNGEIKCSSPWREDSNPSCYLNESKKVFKDFSSGKGGDIFDFIAEMAGLNIKTDFRKVLQIAEQITGIKAPEKAPRNDVSTPETQGFKQRATYSDYVSFFQTHLGETRRDIFSGDLMYRTPENQWQVAASRLKVMGSHAMDTGYLRKNALEEHLARFADDHRKQLLVDIPAWDGVDRIKQLAACIKLKNCSQNHFEELLKDWGARMFQRVYNPQVQNRIIVMKGGQGIGKDYLLNEMLGALGGLMTNLTISRNEADNFAMLADHMVINISEFDRAAKVEAGTLKAWINQPTATFRRPYEKSHRRYDLRCSFIATVNVDEILRDHTGGRRFIIFDIESIDWSYPKGQSLQFLAQFHHLAQEDFHAAQDAQECMKSYIADQTPDDPNELILSDFDDRMLAFEQGNPSSNGRFSFTQIRESLADIAKVHSIRLKDLQTLLKREGRKGRDKNSALYFRKQSR